MAERSFIGAFVTDLFLPWDVLNPINVELVGDVHDDHRFELLPLVCQPAL